MTANAHGTSTDEYCLHCCYRHKYLGSVIFAFKNTLTTSLNHKTCINISGQGLKNNLFAIDVILTKDNSLSKTKVGGLCRKQSLHAQNVKQT